MTAVLSNAVTGFIFLMALSFMIKDFDAQILSENAIHPQMVQVFLDISHAWTLVFVIIIMLTIFFSGNALLLAASRMTYAFSRDGALPKCFCSLNKRTGLPVNSVWLNVAVAGTLHEPLQSHYKEKDISLLYCSHYWNIVYDQ